ncbi:NAD(P)/FAD-dependent oxidoreductase [Natroniella sulfidigena]|uniref:NAD(P)/FAD-dependent oxidoreductase n=1 Tax=Natroniella sulfidigena TaxID=723921 RepID=UPI00200B5F23|nr:NAD(P)/FAD-dependent oxidoreductase [Natroniella sulfidigena]MCK8816923.1 NAD(P)/FAD-dependent oxidoreductase [Natroniella sulfidigena]
MYDLIVAGGGAAGMMAAGCAAQRGKKVLLLEKNEQLGKKLLITGKGRCNLTNDCDVEEIIENFPGNGKFLYSSLYSFSNWQLREFFSKLGVETKVERGGRVFPTSDSARDIVEALKRFIKENGVEVRLKEAVEQLMVADGEVKGVKTMNDSYSGKNILLAVGGAAYPTTGSSGDGYQLARQVGHNIIKTRPSLVPLEVKEEWVTKLQGLKLKNVTVTLTIAGEEVREEFGEMLFTHFGVSGPIILTLSREVANNLNRELKLKINLKPALSIEQLDERLQRDFAKYSRKQFKNSLGDLLPKGLIPIMINLSSIPEDKFVNQITREERRELLELLTCLELTITGTKGFRRAIVTAGGIDTEEIDPSTLESKLVEGLYFAGEIVDIDAYTGGFNLQAAFSMGHVVGNQV